MATELGHELALRGHEVHFITYEMPFRLNIDSKNIYFHRVETNQYELFKYPDYALTLAVKIASVAKEFSLDVLHVHYAIPHATSAYLAKQLLGASAPVVITTLHGTDITLVGRDPGYFEIVKYSMEQSDGVTAVSQDLKRQTERNFHPKKAIEVIYNFFVPKKVTLLRERFVSGKEKLLIHSSNFRAVKRPEDVLHIFMHVRKTVPCKLLFLGAGAGIETVKQMVYDRKLSEEVIFLGKNIEVDPYIASADLLLLPSSQESFGVVALEAMAYGVPVIASRVGGIPEVVIDGQTGYLSEVGAVEDMAQNALSLLHDEKMYQAFSQAGKRRAKEHFSIERILAQYLGFYEKILKGVDPR